MGFQRDTTEQLTLSLLSHLGLGGQIINSGLGNAMKILVYFMVPSCLIHHQMPASVLVPGLGAISPNLYSKN